MNDINKPMQIGSRVISDNSKAFIIAELSANHSQSIDIAVQTIRAAKEAGADAIKFQTYTPDTITLDCDNEYFQIKQGTIWDGTTLYKLYQRAYTPWEWQPKLKEMAEKLGLICFSSPFDNSAVDFLEKMNVPAYKIASFEITDLPLIEYVASKNKPVIISTGIATLEDIEAAVLTCKNAGNEQIALLKCTSEYPTPLEDVNLRTISDLKDRFETVVGVSDHTTSIVVPVSSIVLGGRIVEKHFILDRTIESPDSKFSLIPKEFKEMVQAVRDTEISLGKVTYELSAKAKKSREHSRSLFIVKELNKGDVFTEENVKSIRPGFGIYPKYLKEILGKKATKDIERGTPLNWDLIEQ
jgi:pseudaminic acid synthase